jgi:hypothetical protein
LLALHARCCQIVYASADFIHFCAAAAAVMQGPVTWSWPQQQLYAPATAPALPSIICCTWDESFHAQQGDAAATQHAAADLAAAVPSAKVTRGRRTSTSTAAAAAKEASSQPQQQQQQAAGAVALQPRLAVIHVSDHLPGAHVLAGLQPLLQDACRSNVLFESKRCHTELSHWGLQLAGEPGWVDERMQARMGTAVRVLLESTINHVQHVQQAVLATFEAQM